MANVQNISISKAPALRLAWEGLLLGGKTGFMVSTLYAAWGILIIEILGQGVGFSSLPSEAKDWVEFFNLIFVTTIIVLFVAIIPATIIGAMTGIYLGQLAKLLAEILPSHLFLSLCVSSGLVVVILFHVLLRIPISLTFQNSPPLFSIGVYETYPFTLGIPSVIYVLMCIRVGWKLYSNIKGQRDV